MNGDIWTGRPDGTNLVNLTRTADVEESNATWSADGSMLAFQSYANGGGVDVMNADGSERRRVADGFPRNASYFTDSLAWAPNRQDLAIAFVTGSVAVVDGISGERLELGEGTRWLAWSSTGRYLAWADGKALRVYDRLREAVSTVIEMDSNIRWINWFPSEDRLLFVGFSEAPGTVNTDLFAVNLDGSDLSTPAGQTAAGDDDAQLSPDGLRVLFTRSYAWDFQAEDDIALLKLGDTEPIEVLEVPGLGIARWSPDGQRAIAERNGRIFVLGLDGTAPVEVAAGYAPVWQPIP
jgi:Tol biopolymer transport system component